MKIVSFLKSCAGKVTLNAPSALVLSMGVGILTVSVVNNMSDNMAKKELAARSISSISNTYNYEGLHRTKDGLSSMNMANLSGNYDRVATAEERARMEAANNSSDRFGLAAADSLGGKVSATATGSAAQLGESDGLGMGKNAVIMQEGTAASQAGAQGPRVSGGAVSRAGHAAQLARASGRSGNQLQTSSVRTTGGSGVNATFGSGSAATVNATSGRNTGRTSGGDGYRLSGSMPSGTNPVSMRGTMGGKTAGFGANRSSSVGQARSFKSTGNELKDIAKHSAQVAGNSHRSANEGSRPFLAAGNTTAGISFDNGTETTTASSSDFERLDGSLHKGVQNWQQTTVNKEEDRAKARTKLIWWMVGVLGALVVAVPIACKLLNSGNVWTVVAGYAILAAVALSIVHMLRVAWLYRQACKELSSTAPLSTVGDVLGALAMGVVTLAAIPATRQLITKNVGKIWKYLFKSGLSLGGKYAVGKIQQSTYTNTNK